MESDFMKMYVDADGNPIDIDTVYKDIKNDVNDIHIVEVDGKYFARPDGLDEELLESVCNGLIPVVVKSEKGVLKNNRCIKV